MRRICRETLDIRRFGKGYWLGLCSSTLVCLSYPAVLSAMSEPASSNPLTVLAFVAGFSLLGTAIAGEITGMVLSFADFAVGVHRGDRHQMIGGVLGILVTAPPLLVMLVFPKASGWLTV